MNGSNSPRSAFDATRTSDPASAPMPTRNRRIVLAARPAGVPKPDDFRLETVPISPVGDGQILLRTLYLSLDPYMRGRMSERPSYRPPVALGDVMVGAPFRASCTPAIPDSPSAICCWASMAGRSTRCPTAPL
jgi:hypothetical protein